MQHPTTVLLSNPQALRIEFSIDEGSLELWWSPLAGESFACEDRTFSSRDDHLNVFERVSLPGCRTETFIRCDYDPYHAVLHFADQRLHLVPLVKEPAVLLWSTSSQPVDFKTERYDLPLERTDGLFAVRHVEPSYTFEFAAALGHGKGAFRHSDCVAAWQSTCARAELAPEQLLVIGVGIEGEGIREQAGTVANRCAAELLSANEDLLAPCLAMGRPHAPRHPELDRLRTMCVRVLHSMIDECGAFRASLKQVYYLVWVRDGGFSFPYQASAGWPYKLPAFCRLLLSNPTEVQTDKGATRRMFAQLVHRTFGKWEEDGLFYVVWSCFTQWTQTGRQDFLSAEDWALLEEALATIEERTWDENRGLFGEHFADETPTFGSRDHGWDYAQGKPTDYEDVVRLDGKYVVRSYDLYFNLLMHATYTMLSRMRGPREGHAYAEKAATLWPRLDELLHQREQKLPVYGEVLLEDGTHAIAPPYSLSRSVYVWGLTLPTFTPRTDWDEIRASLLDDLLARPRMHFVNAICSAMTAVDPWLYGEDTLIDFHYRLRDETFRPGTFLPMGGAMPEKFEAPDGDLHHDIRPQGFAIGSWLAAWSSLGVRRLPHGLALRPTRAFDSLTHYPWRNRHLNFHFGAKGRALALEINGKVVTGTLQIPEGELGQGQNDIRLAEAAPSPLWLRSTVQLDSVHSQGRQTTYRGQAFGLSEIGLDGDNINAIPITLEDEMGRDILLQEHRSSVRTLYFTYWGNFALHVTR